MTIIKNLNEELANVLEKEVLKHWKDNCQFIYDIPNWTCDVYIDAKVPIVIKHFGGKDDVTTFIKCGAECITVDRYDYQYITIE